MKKLIEYRVILIILIPFIVAEVINRSLSYGISHGSSLLMTTSEILLFLWKYISVVFWFWAGRQFSSYRFGKLKSFVLGNFLWGVSLVLFTWQFIFVSDTNRSFFLAGISQYYMLGFVSWSATAIGIFSNTISSITVGLIAHVMMLVVFTAGFVSADYKRNL